MGSASQLGRDRPLVLVVMDGVGVGSGDAFDEVALANTPTLDRVESGAYRTLRAHGTAVGLPSDADMGNSEVGHNILGAGRIFDQGAKRIDKAVASGAIWRSAAWRRVVEVCAGGGGTLHLIGLLSDGNVHSNISHLHEILRQAAAEGIATIRIHALFDGRDVPDPSAERYIALTAAEFTKYPSVDIRFASGGGRMVTTMDRYGADWRVVEAGWRAHVLGEAQPVSDLVAGVEWGRSTGVRSDQLLPAFTVVDEFQHPVGPIVDGDAVVMFNFRGDRAIELSQAFEAGPEFDEFDRGRVPDVHFAGMALYDGDTNTPSSYLVEPESVDTTVSEIIATAGITQWAGAETQKFGHITYFWNGNRSSKFDDRLETYVEIPSDLVPFDQRPWMKSAETADAAIEAVRSGEFGFIRMNLAGGDMVGHTADLPATRIAVESVDLAIGRIADAVAAASGCLLVTADHGNADDKVERDGDGTPLRGEDGEPLLRTAHSLNPVMFAVHDFGDATVSLRDDLPQAGLANVASTILQLLDLAVPSDYEPSLLRGSDSPRTADVGPV
ncbi:MAG TPA: 2,3-bisphosphoglycerate-independent phosphoglycerate mutase [Ilumatobacteraceae bacterium]|nr:2,3-bisphosphoglycerate-independent phosphoglycerate mutase [Ilumatobacteraceae bacterium]